MKKDKKLQRVIKEVSHVAGLLWNKGWAERNAGNISINLTQVLQFVEQDIEYAEKYIDLDGYYPELSGEIFLFTASGTRMRDVAIKPEKNTLVIRVNAEGNRYKVLFPANNRHQLKPTSELPMHFAIHKNLIKKGRKHNTILHAHATELIALTHDKEICKPDKINSLLWSMHAETAIFIPQGVGFVPFCMPGSIRLANETAKTLKNYDIALLEKHGAVAVSNSVTQAFDTLDILSKAAAIYCMCKSAQIDVEPFSKRVLDDLRALGDDFK